MNKNKKMDKKSFKLSTNENKLFHCSDQLFSPYSPSPVVYNNAFPKEEPQSVDSWKRYVERSKLLSLAKFKRSRKHKIYIYPIGPFPDYFNQDGIFCLDLRETLKKFIEIFFPGMCALFMDKVIDHRKIRCTTRTHEKSMQKQLFLPDINLFLSQLHPKDAFCVCGFSWFDFYPSNELNHILGEGSFHNGTVAFSFGHYSKFKEKEAKQKEWEDDFVVEPSIEINAHLNKNGQNEENDSSSYIYVTYGEKLEAQNRISDHEHDCISTPKRKTSSPKYQKSSYSSPKLRRLSSKLHSLVSKTSQKNSASSSPITSPNGSHDGIKYMTDDSSVLGSVSDIHIQDRVNNDDHNEIDVTDYDTCDDANEMNNYDFNSSSIDVEHDKLLKSALPTGCEFELNCRVLRRTLRVISHEICHVMGMMHCQYYNCTLNASISVLHADDQPLLLCPVCLRKLQLTLKFDLLQRYKGLDGFLTENVDSGCSCRQRQSSVANSLSNNACKLRDDINFIREIIDFMTR